MITRLPAYNASPPPFNNKCRLSGLNIHKLLSTFAFQNEIPPFIVYLKPYLMRIFLTTVP